MKKALVLMLSVCTGVYAESRVLAPVVDNSTYPGGSSSVNSSSPTNPMYELFGRLEQMQTEIQQLRGLVEEQSQTIAELKKRQSNIYSDLDTRLQELSGVDVQDRKSVMFNNNDVGVAANRSAGTATVDQNNKKNLNQAIYADEQIVTDPTQTQEPMSSNVVVDQGALYQEAYNTLRNGHNTRAISKFKALLTDFPDGDYAANSQYWLGEAYKVNNDIKSAKQAFSKVVTQHSHSLKVPDALLKLGYIELDQNNMAKARDYLTRLTSSYPDSTAAHLATKKLAKIRIIQP